MHVHVHVHVHVEEHVHVHVHVHLRVHVRLRLRVHAHEQLHMLSFAAACDMCGVWGLEELDGVQNTLSHRAMNDW